MKRNDTPCLFNTLTFISITGVCFDDRAFRYFRNGRIDYKDVFHAAIYL